MTTITLTGSSGLVGSNILKALIPLLDSQPDTRVRLADRSLKANALNGQRMNMSFVKFDFEDPSTWAAALEGTTTLFLLRPPQIADVKAVFNPLMEVIEAAEVQHIVFLSVQGAPETSIIPHHKIERLIIDSGIPYTFLRPAYFMQNFLGNLRKDLVKYRHIYVPAGSTPISLIDVRDLGEVAAQVLAHPDQYLNQGFDLTSDQRLSFEQMANIISKQTGQYIRYHNAWLVPFILHRLIQSDSFGLSLVMALLHYAPRWRAPSPLTDEVLRITGHAPTTFDEFARRDLTYVHDEDKKRIRT